MCEHAHPLSVSRPTIARGQYNQYLLLADSGDRSTGGTDGGVSVLSSRRGALRAHQADAGPTAGIICAWCNSKKVRRSETNFLLTHHWPTPIQMRKMHECASCKRLFTPDQVKVVLLAIRGGPGLKGRAADSGGNYCCPKKVRLEPRANSNGFSVWSKVITRWETGRVVQSRMVDVASRPLALDPENLKGFTGGATKCRVRTAGRRPRSGLPHISRSLVVRSPRG